MIIDQIKWLISALENDWRTKSSKWS